MSSPIFLPGEGGELREGLLFWGTEEGERQEVSGKNSPLVKGGGCDEIGDGGC